MKKAGMWDTKVEGILKSQLEIVEKENTFGMLNLFFASGIVPGDNN